MKNPELFTLSEKGKSGEYTASVVRIHNLRPIEGSDFLVLAEAAGEDVVVRKDEVKEGDIMVYCRIETVLDPEFLGANNLFDPESYMLNQNAREYERVREEQGKEEARKLCGYFNRHGRVRIARLRGCPSKGFLFDKEALMKWKPGLFEDVNLEDYLDIPCFDTIDGKQFIKVYIPYIPSYGGGQGSRNRDKKLKMFDRILPEYFSFHYDTGQLTMLISEVRPNHVVSISVKLHGTSTINGNILTRYPVEKPKLTRFMDKIRRKKARDLGEKIKGTKSPRIKETLGLRKNEILSKIKPSWIKKYDEIYSSRNVIKNQYINRTAGPGYYKTDVWKIYADLLEGKLNKGTTIYGEIVGFEEGSQRMIQKGYDYGCELGTSKLMIYRVVNQGEDGKKNELDVPEVRKFTLDLMKKYPELKDRLHPIDILFHGTLVELYPDLNPRSETWNDDVLQRLKHETRFGMQEGNREEMCVNKVPREGIVMRIDGLPTFCAKLKTDDYFLREAKNTDKGEVDIEMAQML